MIITVQRAKESRVGWWIDFADQKGLARYLIGPIIYTFVKYKLLVQTCADDMIWVLYPVKTFEYINAETNSIA